MDYETFDRAHDILREKMLWRPRWWPNTTRVKGVINAIAVKSWSELIVSFAKILIIASINVVIDPIRRFIYACWLLIKPFLITVALYTLRDYFKQIVKILTPKIVWEELESMGSRWDGQYNKLWPSTENTNDLCTLLGYCDQYLEQSDVALRLFVKCVLFYWFLISITVSLYRYYNWLAIYGEAIVMDDDNVHKVINVSHCQFKYMVDPLDPSTMIQYLDTPWGRLTGYPGERPRSGLKETGLVRESAIQGSYMVPCPALPKWSFSIRTIDNQMVGGGFRVGNLVYLSTHELQVADVESLIAVTNKGQLRMTKALWPIVGSLSKEDGDITIMKPLPAVFTSLGLATGKWVLSKQTNGFIRVMDASGTCHTASGPVIDVHDEEYPATRYHDISTFPGSSGYPIENSKGIVGMHIAAVDKVKHNLFIPAAVLISYTNFLCHDTRESAVIADFGSNMDSVDSWDNVSKKMRRHLKDDVAEVSDVRATEEEKRFGINQGGRIVREMNPLPNAPTVPVPLKVEGPQVSGTGPEQKSMERARSVDGLGIQDSVMLREIYHHLLKDSKKSVSGILAPSQEDSKEKQKLSQSAKKRAKQKAKALKGSQTPTSVAEVSQDPSSTAAVTF